MIGAGIVGNSVAYHLTQLGETDLTLIDKGPLPNPGGSTGHASNFIFPVDHSKEMTALTLESMRQYKELDVFTESGGIEIARTEERMQELRRRMASAKSWGIEPVSLVTPAEVKELVPFIDESLILGGFYTPGRRRRRLAAGRHAHARARDRGGDDGLRQHRGARGSTSRTAVSRRVRTTRGDFDADLVVIACGVWSPRIARMAGASIPLTPMVHQMIDIGPAPRFADTTGDDRVPDRPRHGHQHVRAPGGHRPRDRLLRAPPDHCSTPTRSRRSRSPRSPRPSCRSPRPTSTRRWSIALELMPEIVGDETVGVKYAINGLLSVTGDGMPLLGETPEVEGLWSAAAVWIKEGPGVGKTVAELIVHGESEIDVYGSNIARATTHQRTSGPHRRPRLRGLQQDVRDRPSRRAVGVRPPRPLRPFYERERALGAVFFEAAGWERPHWYESNAGLLDEYGDRVTRREAEWESRWWSPIINAEHLAMRDRAGMIDLSAFAIFDVTGSGRARRPSSTWRCARWTSRVGRVVYTPLLTPGGGFKQDLTIMRIGHDRFRVVTGGAYGMSDLKWFADHLPADGSAQVHDQTNAWTTLGLWGPRARDILRVVTGDDVSHEGMPVRHLQDARGRHARRCSPRGSPMSATSAGSCTCRSSRARGCGTSSPRPARRTG